MHFAVTDRQRRVQQTARELAATFAARASDHDQAATSPLADYADLKAAGLYGLSVPEELGGAGAGILGSALALEELGAAAPATALSFSMHVIILAMLTYKSELAQKTRQRVADLAVGEGRLFCSLLSEPATTGLLYATRRLATTARKVEGGWALSGRKAFASMVDAADYGALFVHPEQTAPDAAMLVLLPLATPGAKIERVWDTLGMRATRSDTLVLTDCVVPDSAALAELEISSLPELLRQAESLGYLLNSAVYLGVGVGALRAAIDNARSRRPQGFRQSLAHHPDIRRRVAKMSAELEAARWLLRYAAWLLDVDAPPDQVRYTFLKAKYVVGQAVTRATRSALEAGGAHGVFKGSPVELFFRDAATAPIMPPNSDLALWELGIHELGLDPADVAPPMR